MNSPALSDQPLPEMDPAHARALTDRIKVAVEGTWLLIQEAYASRAWASLGYGSWDDYCTREFGTSRLRLPREERQEVVHSMREIGMSTRAIASATGHNRETVMNDLRQVAGNQPPAAAAPARHDLDDVLAEAGIDPDELDDDTDDVPVDAFGPPPTEQQPQKITGTDGKTYTQPAVSRPTQKPRTDVVATVNRALQRAHDAARAADEVGRQHLVGRTTEAAAWVRSLGSSLESLQRLHDLMKETS